MTWMLLFSHCGFSVAPILVSRNPLAKGYSMFNGISDCANQTASSAKPKILHFLWDLRSSEGGKLVYLKMNQGRFGELDILWPLQNFWRLPDQFDPSHNW
ncbi:uncharacterized protein BT62DRAFT_607508 [Guyanagaster necrorhizus]|uniref:Uncharacterized protein n=1 Tax=Guyanagaster necrorhizus TaxID=856835 RepID=A0A9P7W1S3_9AGAR|nr:uncharacterized protein BT62DRAFT_607508 [Guyanagaster necrorhizus MCA 3950]KAG7449801.1 hypothetical protein BT62DRAFT_607508 [Guyanagaster necrorhizus MCA 3950]